MLPKGNSMGDRRTSRIVFAASWGTSLFKTMARASRLALVLIVMLAAGLQATARSALPTTFEHTYGYDDHWLGRGEPTKAESVPLTLRRGTHTSRIAAFHVYDSPRRQVLHRFQKSSGKERDGETGLDYFIARYYSGAQGRFTSPDWSEKPQPVPYADFSDPQTLNLYSYVRNNPLLRADEDGHCGTLCTGAIGAGAGFVGSIVIQKWSNPNKPIDWQKVAASAISGGVAGLTLGLGTAPTTLITLKTTTTIGTGLAPTLATAAGAGVVGGIAGRVVEGKEPLGETPGEVATDAVIEMTGEIGSLALKPVLKETTTAGRALTTLEKQRKPHPTSLDRRTAQHARHVEGAGESVEQATQGAVDSNYKEKKK